MAVFAEETGAQLIAEGVERLDDFELLRRATRAILVQGYAIGRPSESWAKGSEGGPKGSDF